MDYATMYSKQDMKMIQILSKHNIRGTPQAWAPERGTGPKERVAGPRGMDPLGPVPEYLISHHSWARGDILKFG